MVERLKVADFFCGAGGFSEGFRQAGFDIVFAVDKWNPAVTTYKANLAHTNVKELDVAEISRLDDEKFEELIPDTEVIIGSPPCVAFSNSNKSGNADKELGIELFTSFLRIIARKWNKKNSILKYWILENVPNIETYIEEKYTAKDLELKGIPEETVVLEPKKSLSCGVYNVKYYGAPTNRNRYICGEFPIPEKTTELPETFITLGKVLETLKKPSDIESQITDCNYPDLSLQYSEVTDHDYTYFVEKFEWESAKRLKKDRGYMGKMSFPERLDRPSRTVMATMSASSRESMVLKIDDSEEYRLPTVREAASMMSFPIDYRFYGRTRGTKYTLVGNAVPPKFSNALAKAIASEESMEIPSKYIPIEYDPEIEFVNLNGKPIERKKERKKRNVTKFKYHIPYLIISSYRVELTNRNSDMKRQNFKWDAEIHYSQGRENAKCHKPCVLTNMNDTLKKKIYSFLDSLKDRVTTFNDFQGIFCMTEEERGKRMGPYELLSAIRKFIDDNVIDPSETITLGGLEKPIPRAIAVGYTVLVIALDLMKAKGIPRAT